MDERMFSEREVRQLLWLIGYLLPLNLLGRVYDRLDKFIRAGEHSEIAPLMRVARGTWQNAGDYGVGSDDDQNCDPPSGSIW